MTVLSISWRSLDCHRGIKCSRCTHSAAAPFSMHASHASWTWNTLKSGSPVTLFRILISRE